MPTIKKTVTFKESYKSDTKKKPSPLSSSQCDDLMTDEEKPAVSLDEVLAS